MILTAVTIPLAYFIVWRNYPVLRVLNLAAELPYALPGVVLAIQKWSSSAVPRAFEIRRS